MIRGARGTVEIPWEHFDAQFRALAVVGPYGGGTTINSPMLKLPICRVLINQIIGTAAQPYSTITGKIDESPNGTDSWVNIYTFPSVDGPSNLFALVQRTQPYIRYSSLVDGISQVVLCCIVAFEITSDARGVAPHPLAQFDVRPYVLRPPIIKGSVTGDISPTLKLPAACRFQAVQMNSSLVAGGYQHGRIEQSPDGVAGWTTLYTFPVSQGYQIKSALVKADYLYVRHITTIDAISTRDVEAKAGPAPPPPAITSGTGVVVYF